MFMFYHLAATQIQVGFVFGPFASFCIASYWAVVSHCSLTMVAFCLFLPTQLYPNIILCRELEVRWGES